VAIVGRSDIYRHSLLSASSSLSALLLHGRLHQFLDKAIIDARLPARGGSLRSVAVDCRAAVVDERSDAARHLPATISRAIVGVVEEALVVILLVLNGLWRRVEGVVYGAFESGHAGKVKRSRLGGRFEVML
jgi:hypothetical protein